ncbi:Glycoside hydrolase, family 77 [Desulfonema limicola]|uniref:4-alpha-glucanotransferase n=1 Tax=Desulfonema limicola TaxID=45656 RepID=A0A975BAB0_9BACT|nr:4-alpha-glucanotransferase [Desulfonema limicola]QTA81651.1 Glycoside hydrolase, family 77 [Desulfonema limicola]
MIICFSIHYNTVWGQKLCVSGSIPELGNWNPEQAPEMIYTSGGIWVLKLDFTKPVDFKYKYCLMDENKKSIKWESGENRMFLWDICISKNISLIDSWRKDSEIENLNYKKGFKIFSSKLNHQEPGRIYRFQVKSPFLYPGHQLFIVGSDPCIGNWDMKNAKFLEEKKHCLWSTDLEFIRSDFILEYKYGICDKNNREICMIEDGRNRTITINSDKENIFIIKTDENVHYPEKMWKGAGAAIPVFSLRTKNNMGTGEFLDIKLLVDWAKITGLKIIQILPVNDTISSRTKADSSPYSTISVFALHPLYLNITALYRFYNKKIEKSFYKNQELLNKKSKMDYEAVINLKLYYIKEIYNKINQDFLKDPHFKIFFHANKKWLKPYAAFSYLRDFYKTCEYSRWGKHEHLSSLELEKFTSPGSSEYNEICMHYFIQYHLHLQLSEAARYARKNNIILKGDIPIGVNRFSADTWSSPELFNMNTQTGAPPDDFSEHGQNWQFPTYNWEVMAENRYTWWQNRLKKMADYFDGFRIDHILGFFRIWEIPMDCIQGVMGYFNPSLPLNLDELNNKGIKFDFKRFCEPFINDNMLDDLFGRDKGYVTKTFLDQYKPGFYKIKPLFKTQRQVEKYFGQDHKILFDSISDKEKIKQGLFKLISEVLFIKADSPDKPCYHPRIDMIKTSSYKNLDEQDRLKLRELYIDYFYKRHEKFWYSQGMKKLPVIKNATTMLVCGEDLGMVPGCVPDVMEELGILSLNIQRMPKKLDETFNNPANNPYLSVCTTSSHDMSTLRGWWEQEEKEKIQLFFNTIFGHKGKAPETCEPWICKEIINQHLNSPSMWAIFPIQDILGIDASLRRENTAEEQINNPR